MKNMNINNLHQNTNPISVSDLNNNLHCKVKAIRILANEQLKEHISKVLALLICISGNVIFEDENGEKRKLTNGDFINIEPNVKHQVYAWQDSVFILIK